jgi:O-6-methylguanine DNA methyltransferase
MAPSEENGIIIKYNKYDTPFGVALIASTDKGICYIAFGEENLMEEELKRRYPKATFAEENAPLHMSALSLITGSGTGDSIPIHIKGTDFQVSVWNELLRIPFGKKSTYKRIAEQIGQPKAIRAVGTAVGQNPVSCLIPCHRVVRSDNTLGGYHWGLGIKERMLNHESAT